jgi:hypothetical protein
MRRTPRGFSVWTTAGLLLVLAPPAARAQFTDLISPPANVTLANPNSLPPGPTGSLEGGAFIARADDGSSNWYNAAGLARATVSSASATAGSYQISDITPSEFPDSTGGGVTNVPALVGIVIKKAFNHDPHWTAGIGAVTLNDWNQTLAAQLTVLTPGYSERFAFTAASEWVRQQLSVAVGYSDGGRWRFGFGIAGEYTGIYKIQTLSDVVTAPGGVESLLVSSRFKGSQLDGRGIGGVQYDISDEWKLGASVQTMGFRVAPSGEVALDGVRAEGNPSATSYLFDTDATFKYKVPLQAGAGIAWVGKSAQVEVDVNYLSGSSSYSMLTSEVPVTLIENGQPPTTTTAPWSGLTTDPKGTFNFAVGGHFALDEKQIWKLHFGFATNFAPVDAGDQVFTNLDLYAGTVGLSGQAGHIQASLGVRYEFGSSDKLFVTNPITGAPLQTDVKVSNIGAVYSLAYLF